MFLQIDFGWHFQTITGDSQDSVRAATSGGDCGRVEHGGEEGEGTRQQSGS